MIPALIIATVLYLGAWTKQSKKVYYLSMALMFMFVVFRSINISGYDSTSYMLFFDNIPTLDKFNWKFWDAEFMYGYGWGYALINSAAKSIIDNYFCFQVVDTTIVFVLLIIVINKLKLDYKEKCMFLFVLFCSKFIWYFFVLLRQNIANLITWYIFIDWESNRNHKWRKYARDIILILIATSFHSTVAFMFFAYPIFILMNRFSEKNRVRIAIAVALISTVITSYMMPFIWKIVVHVAGSRYMSYDGWGVGGINMINYTLRIVYVLLIMRFGKNFYKYNNSLNGSIMALLVGSINVTFNMRIIEYFAVGYYSGISHIKGYLKKQERMLVFIGVYGVYILFLLQYILVNNPKMIHYQIYPF